MVTPNGLIYMGLRGHYSGSTRSAGLDAPLLQQQLWEPLQHIYAGPGRPQGRGRFAGGPSRESLAAGSARWYSPVAAQKRTTPP